MIVVAGLGLLLVTVLLGGIAPIGSAAYVWRALPLEGRSAAVPFFGWSVGVLIRRVLVASILPLILLTALRDGSRVIPAILLLCTVEGVVWVTFVLSVRKLPGKRTWDDLALFPVMLATRLIATAAMWMLVAMYVVPLSATAAAVTFAIAPVATFLALDGLAWGILARGLRHAILAA